MKLLEKTFLSVYEQLYPYLKKNEIIDISINDIYGLVSVERLGRDMDACYQVLSDKINSLHSLPEMR
jgi:hypothetical protein